MSENSIGNLSFDQYTLETEAEKHIVSLEALLLVNGYHDSSEVLRSLSKLKRSMKRNKTKRYSFSVHPVVPVESEKEEEEHKEESQETEELLLVRDLVAKTTGLPLRKTFNKITSSGYNLTTFVLAGPLEDLLFDPSSPLLREHIASAVLEHTKKRLFSFSVCSLKVKEKGTSVGVRCQCAYKGSGL